MDKKKMILTSLASVAVLGAAFAASQPSVVKAEEQPAASQSAGDSQPTPAAETPKTEVEKAKEAEKEANAKVDEAQAKVDTTTTAADEATTKLEAEKKEAAEADAAKTKAEEAKKTAADELAAAKEKAAEADAKAKEEAKKEEDAKKEEADSKDALSKALDQLEESIANDPKITDKEAAKKAAKELVDKEGLLKAIESGDLKAGDILKELENDNNTASNPATTPAEAKTKDQLPADIKAGIDKAEKADAARPASEKLQDKADDLGENVDELKEDAEALKAEEDKKAEALKKQEDTLKEAEEALKSATDNGSDSDIVSSLDKAVKAIKKERDAAQNAFDQAASDTKVVADELNKLTDEYNKALDEVKAAKEKEANEPAKPVEEEPAKPAEKTEAEKAAEAKAEADAKVAELQKKADEAKTKADEATAKAEKEAADVKAAQTKKEEADKAKTEAETELATAKAEAEKAKAKVEELKKEEAETRTALKDALDQLEKDIDADAKITNKEEAKKALGKEDILAAVEKGDLTAGDVLKELKDQNETAEANKNQDPQADEIGATKQEGKPLAELPTAAKEKLDAAYNKEASKPIVKKLQDIADDIAEKIEKLTKVADKDKADATEKAKAVEEKNAALDKQKETLEKAKTALATAKKNNAEQSIQDGLQDAVTRLEAAVASAKTAADEAQAKFDEVNEVVKAYKDAIDELTDDYNATLGYIENLKEVPKGEEPKDFAGGVNDDEAPTGDAKQPDEVPTVPNAPEFNGGVNPADAPTAEENPEFAGGVNAAEAATTEEKPEFNGGVNAVEAAVNEVPEFNGGVNDDNAPTEPSKPEGEAPKTAKPETSNGDALVQPELPEFGANNPEIKKILDEIAKVKEQIKDSEENEGVEDYYKDGLKDRLSDLEEALNTLINNKAARAENEQLVVTRYIDIDSNADILEAEAGNFKGKPIAGYTFVKSEEENGIITNYYRRVDGNYNKGPQIEQQSGRNGGDYPGDRYIINRPSATPDETTPSTPAPETPSTPAPGTDAPSVPTAETPATPAVAPTVAGTNKDNTYQAPAVKAEDKKELPNTGGKDNVAVASLGFLGLLLGALPFVKRKN